MDMRYYINPERRKKTINFTDHIVYSQVKDPDGNPLSLELSIMSMSGNSELKAAAADAKETDKVSAQPVVLWFSGGGYRGVDKNQMIAELQFLAEAGYAVVMAYYRSSAQGHWPDQLIDAKTAVRFLRAHKDQYLLDTDHIGVMGRSAGGHLSAVLGLNLDGYESGEWSGYSSKVQAVLDMFGPVDTYALLQHEGRQMAANPDYRWHTLIETHGGALIGGDPDTLMERSKAASIPFLMDQVKEPAPLLILHGDSDWLVPPKTSENFYDLMVEAGFEAQTDLYLLKGAGHGTPEFFQPQVREIAKNFFAKNLGTGQI